MTADYGDLASAFSVAQTPEEYQPVRRRALEMGHGAARSGQTALAVDLALLAADCAWWSRDCVLADDPDQAAVFLRQVILDLRVVAIIADHSMRAMSVEQFGSLAQVTLHAALRDPGWKTDPALTTSVLLEIVPKVRAIVPANLVFTTYGRGASTRTRLAIALAELDADIAKQVDPPLIERLIVARQLAAEEGEALAWGEATAALIRYGSHVLEGHKLSEIAADWVDRVDLREFRRSRLGRLLASQDTDDVVGALVVDLLERGESAAPVLALAERASARTLLDGLDGLLATTNDDTCRSLERRALAHSAPAEDPAARELRLTSRLPVAPDHDLETLEQRYAELGVGFSGTAAPVTIRQVQALLAPDQVMLRYVMPRRTGHPSYLPHVLVVTSDDARLVRLPTPKSELLESRAIGSYSNDRRSWLDISPLNVAIAEVRMRLRKNADASSPLRQLGQFLFERALDTGLTEGRPHWVVVPQRSLHLFPWTTQLVQEDSWLPDGVNLTIAPSASTWARLRNRPPASSQRLCSFADPLVGYAGLNQLPGTRDEAHHVCRSWQDADRPVVARVGAEATYPELVEVASGSAVLHLATHASFPDDAALFDHQLMLAPDIGHTGRVTADQVRQLDLTGVDCVVLGVCDGGAYRLGPGDEPYGLVPAFLEAGARSVVAAQWQVDDTRAHRLLADMGARLILTDPATALRDAVVAQTLAGTIRPDDAAFIVVGAS